MDSVLFIGVGRMGAPMARRLHEAGVPLAVVDVVPEALEPFRTRGVMAAATAATMTADVVITMLPTARHVRDALLHPDGALRHVRPHTVIDMTSASPADTVALGHDLATLGIAMVDAPVSGGTAGAIAGTLTAMVGGDGDVVERVTPLLAPMCGYVRHVGPLGAGHTVKALNNYLSAVALWSASESLLIGSRLGLDPQAMLDVWRRGSGRSDAVDVKLPRHVLTRSFDFGQSLELFCKDLGIAVDLADQAVTPAVALRATAERWNDAKSRLGPQADITAIMQLFEAEAEIAPAASPGEDADAANRTGRGT